MAEYINKKTKAVIESDLVVSGGDWELVEPKNEDKTPTIEELKSLLTELGVEFNPKAKKPELLELYETHKQE
ncbi:HeH/LEM domain-containing protein [Streptococcus sp. S784/96/1]|uniref:HeH/LEM domain-containing protein n=1 Tax=Streptococcus sp. S784/96/1 TaxID=2653499 RepID=UPI001386B7DC|nr:HeH/LEM domain-containing protein [Streptococcus sp. S784/96/1]